MVYVKSGIRKIGLTGRLQVIRCIINEIAQQSDIMPSTAANFNAINDSWQTTFFSVHDVNKTETYR